MKKALLIIAMITAGAVISMAQGSYPIVKKIYDFNGDSLPGSWTIPSTSYNWTTTATAPGLTGHAGYIYPQGYNYQNVKYTINSPLPSSTVDSLNNSYLAFSLDLATQAPVPDSLVLELLDPNGGQVTQFLGVVTLGGSLNPYDAQKVIFTHSTDPLYAPNNPTAIGSVTGFIIFFGWTDHTYQSTPFYGTWGQNATRFFFNNFQIVNTTTTTGNGATTGMADNSIAAQNTSIYPNPSNGTVNITYVSSGTGDVRVTLNDMVGKELGVVQDNGGSDAFDGQVDVSTLSPGIYYVKFQQDGGTSWLKKLVVSK